LRDGPEKRGGKKWPQLWEVNYPQKGENWQESTKGDVRIRFCSEKRPEWSGKYLEKRTPAPPLVVKKNNLQQEKDANYREIS